LRGLGVIIKVNFDFGRKTAAEPMTPQV